MLGIVFTEFTEMIEELFSPEVVDAVLETPGLKSKGIFTSVGYYDHADMVRMVAALSKEVQLPVDDLVSAFGEHLFSKLVKKYPILVSGHDSALNFLATVDSTVHKEVIKLYPQAELPHFSCERVRADKLVMQYQSKRPFSQLALGLIKGCAKYFNEQVEIDYRATDDDQFYSAVFEITRIDG